MAGARKLKGFPAGVRSTPVPNPLLADLLEEIEDIGELKLTLRAVWALNRKRGSPKSLTASELSADQTVARMLGAAGEELERVVDAKLEAAVTRGTFMRAATGFYLNTEENRRALARSGGLPDGSVAEQHPEAWQGPETVASGGAFSAYEENIGPLTPVVIGRMEEALLDHAEEDVVGAIHAAVAANARSWNYISAVLRARGSTTLQGPQGSKSDNPVSRSGRAVPGQRGKDGKPGRNSPQGLTDEFIRKYVERQRARGQPGSGR